MSDKKKTAVDLLLDKITDYEMGETLLRLIGKDEIDHIRKVGREQMSKSMRHGFTIDLADAGISFNKAFELYIKETYGE